MGEYNIDIDRNFTIKDIPVDERPREKMLKMGTGALSNAELLAIIIRTGSKEFSSIELADKIIQIDERGIASLSNISMEELMGIKGIGISKAAQILAAIELGNRIHAKTNLSKVIINNPETIANLFMREYRFEEQEHFLLLLLDIKKQIISKEVISKGTLNASIVHPRDVFKVAIRKNAHSIICLHNHPSGNTSPSKEDVKITEILVESGKIIGIEVLDHIIIGDGKYFSFKEEGMI